MTAQFSTPKTELDLESTLICGQTFRWRLDHDGWWSCVLPTSYTDNGSKGEDQSVRLRQDDTQVWYETYPIPNNLPLIWDYFRMDVNLPSLQEAFIQNDASIAPDIAAFPGLRVLRQDPVENLFSFLCTSAAPLHRIRKSISGLCREYGDPFVTPHSPSMIEYGFPPIERLAEASVSDMMALGLGYRARYVRESARTVLANGGARWLHSLRDLPYLEAKSALITLPGVGEKIADCVCLFSLDKDQAIPVDTHVRQIAYRHNFAPSETRSLTIKGYAQIGDAFRSRFGLMAGWAQQYLFFGDLYQKGSWESYAKQYRPKELQRE